MRSFLLATAALGLIVSSASAADLPRRTPSAAPAPMFTAFSWSGFYVGAQVGYTWANNDLFIPLALGNGPYVVGLSPDAVNVGAFAGYRHQYSNNIVVGIEGDINVLIGDRAIANYVNIGGGFASATTGINDYKWDGSIRATLGYAMGRFLPYITGGFSFIEEKGCAAVINTTVCVANTFFGSTRTGWTLGAGVAYAVTNNLVLNAEYRYADYGSKNITMPTFISGRQTSTAETHRVQVGLSWKFGGSAPVVARY